jgi:uncharacterized membrane protein
MSNGAFAIVFAVVLLLLHLKQVNMLSGSIEEFWHRHDENARISKLFLALSLVSCLITLLSVPIGIGVSIACFALHAGFSMNEWKR